MVTRQADGKDRKDMETDPYVQMAAALPNEVGIGGALITMVEPDIGFEHAYNRWYEDDHFYAGATVGPWMFASRRWVATRDLLGLRYPTDSPIAQPVTAGCYISTYLISAGHYEDARRWGEVAMRDHLYPAGRGFDERQHIYTSFSTYEFGLVRDDEAAMQTWHAMDHPFAGLVVEVIQPDEGTTSADLAARLRDRIPAELSGSPAAIALVFTPQPQRQSSGPVKRVGSAPGAGRDLTLLWFLQVDPRQCWSHFLRHQDSLRGAGGRVTFAAPFVPTIPGTETYVDELR
jgi:hypothetical protein